MSEVRNIIAAELPKTGYKLNNYINWYQVFGFYRYRKEQDHHFHVRVQHCKSYYYTEYGARCADQRAVV